MLSFIEEQKKLIEALLSDYIIAEREKLAAIDPIARDVCDRLFSFIKKGKMLRGALAYLGYSFFKDDNPADVVRLGAILELFQSSLLVHDDIMDRDEKRRGEQSVYYQYVVTAEQSKLAEPYHIGEALGICAGDVGFFLAYGLMAQLGLAADIKTKILSLCSTEMSSVCMAQMLDVIYGAKSSHEGEASVLRLYRHKTGRYTYSLPLALGSIAADAPPKTIAELVDIGEILGIAFQLKDDELGLFGDEQVTGKAVGSDIKEGKKTLYSNFLLNQAPHNEQTKIKNIFGNRNSSADDIRYIRELIENLGIRQLVSQRIEEYSCIGADKVKKLDVPNISAKKNLTTIIDYNLARRY